MKHQKTQLDQAEDILWAANRGLQGWCSFVAPNFRGSQLVLRCFNLLGPGINSNHYARWLFGMHLTHDQELQFTAMMCGWLVGCFWWRWVHSWQVQQSLQAEFKVGVDRVWWKALHSFWKTVCAGMRPKRDDMGPKTQLAEVAPRPACFREFQQSKRWQFFQ